MNNIKIIGPFIIFGILFLSTFRKRKIKQITLQQLVGNTPLIYLKALSKKAGVDIYAKCEFLNPCGSMKDRVALAILNNRTSNLIYEGTSGSTGISLALLGNSLGCTTKLFMPDDMADEKYALIQKVGASICKLRPVSIVDSQHYCKLAQKEA